MLAFEMIPIKLSNMKFVGRGEKEWWEAKNKHSFNDFVWVKNQKIKKTSQKKNPGVGGKKVLSDWQYFASLPLYAVGGTMVLFIRVLFCFLKHFSSMPREPSASTAYIPFFLEWQRVTTTSFTAHPYNAILRIFRGTVAQRSLPSSAPSLKRFHL